MAWLSGENFEKQTNKVWVTPIPSIFDQSWLNINGRPVTVKLKILVDLLLKNLQKDDDDISVESYYSSSEDESEEKYSNEESSEESSSNEDNDRPIRARAVQLPNN